MLLVDKNELIDQCEQVYDKYELEAVGKYMLQAIDEAPVVNPYSPSAMRTYLANASNEQLGWLSARLSDQFDKRQRDLFDKCEHDFVEYNKYFNVCSKCGLLVNKHPTGICDGD